MTEYTAKSNPKRCPTHPGAVLREDMVPASGKKKIEIARLLGISRQHLHDIMEEKKPLSPEVAVRVGKLFGGGPGAGGSRHMARRAKCRRKRHSHTESRLIRSARLPDLWHPPFRIILL